MVAYRFGVDLELFTIQNLLNVADRILPGFELDSTNSSL